MAADPRHLRARWTIAALGWLLWAVSLVLPMSSASPDRIWEAYPGAVEAALRIALRISSVVDMTQVVIVACFLFASGVLASSPLLVRLNHSTNPSVRCWRWVGAGLLPMTTFSIVIVAMRAPISTWPIHLFALAHVLVCIAIVPWPRERTTIQSGFEVLIPDPQRSDCAANKDE